MRRTVEIAPGGPRPSISLRPVPPCEPPFDDELEPAGWVSAHQLAFDWSTPALRPAPESPPAPGRPDLSTAVSCRPELSTPPGGGIAPSAPFCGRSGLSVAPGGRAGMSGPADGRPPVVRPEPVAAASPEARAAVNQFVRACVEVLNGYRPPVHLRRLSVPAEASAVVAQGMVGARRVSQARRRVNGAGRRAARRTPPVAVVRLRMCEPRPGAVEAAVALVTGERTWAMALRMELHEEAWSATILRLI